MFLLHPIIFPWDLGILLMLTSSIAVWIAAAKAAKRSHWLFVRIIARCIALLAAIGVITVAYGSFIEPQIIVTTHRTITLPLKHSLKIAVVSDLHAGPYHAAAFYRRIVETVNAQLPDIIVIDGDFVLEDVIRSDTLSALAPLSDLRPAIGTFAVLGNHDHGVYEHLLLRGGQRNGDESDYLSAYLQSLGVQVLHNVSKTIPLGTEKVTLAGIDDLWSGKANLKAALANIDPGLPLILLSHNPDIITDPLSRQASLIISGHTHGGQIRLPFYGPVTSLPTRISQKYDQGIFSIGEHSTLAITRGVGESGPRARLFAWPEVMVLTAGRAMAETTAASE